MLRTRYRDRGLSNLMGGWFNDESLLLDGNAPDYIAQFNNNRYALSGADVAQSVANTFTRTSTATFTDFEDIIRDVQSGEARLEKLRRVENLLVDPEDLTNAAWVKATLSATVDTITSTGAFNEAIRQTINVLDGEQIIFAVDIKLNSGTVTNNSKVRIGIFGSVATTEYQIGSSLNSGYQRYYVKGTATADGTITPNIRIDDDILTLGIRYPQFEDKTGAELQAPSEYTADYEYHVDGAPPYDYAVVYGDSFTDMLGDLGYSLVDKLGINFSTSGVSGYTLTQIEALMVAEAPLSGCNFVLLEGGINDIIGASSSPVATMQAKMASMTDHAIINNLGFVVYTIGAWSGNASWNANRQTWTEEYNTWVRTTYPDSYVDMYEVLGDPLDLTALNPDYDTGDGLHPNVGGLRAVDLLSLSSGGYTHLCDNVVSGDGTSLTWGDGTSVHWSGL